MALSDQYIETQLKSLLPIDEQGYANQLSILVRGAKSKLKREGVDNVFTEQEDIACDYVICIAYQIAKDMDFDMNYNKTEEQYITRVNGLRTYLSARKENN